MSDKASPPAPPANAAAPATAPDRSQEMVSVFNKGPKFGDFVHPIYEDVKDETGRVTGRRKKLTYTAEAQAFSRVPQWLADLWKKQSPDQIVDADAVGAPKNHQPTNAEVASLRAQNSDLSARFAGLEKLVQELQGPR